MLRRARREQREPSERRHRCSPTISPARSCPRAIRSSRKRARRWRGHCPRDRRPADPLDGDFPPGDDGKIFAAAGIPYVKLGPGTFADRDPRFGREQVRVEQLELAARAYVVLAVRFATRARSETSAWPPVLTRPGQFTAAPGR